jgi:anti-sigma factor RsiW
MNQNIHVDHEQLLAYLYGECDPGERAHVEAHLGGCPACADEVAALTSTRQLLAGWAPPDVALGFQITRTAATGVETPPARNVVPFSPGGVEGAGPNAPEGRAPGRGDGWW